MKPATWIARHESRVAINDVIVPSGNSPSVRTRQYGPSPGSGGDAAPVLRVHGGVFLGGGLDQTSRTP